ncbi:MAG: hypothetical protein ACTHJR_11005 [Sphingomonas sp.]|uniref:hypothetical protein n=1 Tax=Sphingomonas sp. TaxID=28214 RepID=UPI003F7F7867
MTEFIPLDRRVSVALHHAKAALRAHDGATRQHHVINMRDIIDSSDYPSLAYAEVARRLGRQRAYDVALPERFVNAAVRQPKLFEGML